MFTILIIILNIYSFILLARVIMTWIPNVDPTHPIANALLQATEPVLKPIREALPQTGGIDFSPLIVLVLISVISRMLATI
ncbi:MAG: YggT family protein [Anaerolineae bacterium]